MKIAPALVSAAVCGSLLAGAAQALTATAASGTTTTAVPPSPNQIAALSFRAAQAQTAVKWNVRETSQGATVTVQADSGRQTGLRTETIREELTVGSISEILDNSKMYIKGDSFGLRAIANFTPSAATQQAGRWISIDQTQPAYASLSPGLTVSSLFPQLALSGTMTMTRSTVGGQAIFAITGTTATKTTETLYVRMHGIPLPVELTNINNGADATVTFSHWGQRPVVVVPAHAVPLIATWVKTAA